MADPAAVLAKFDFKRKRNLTKFRKKSTINIQYNVKPQGIC